MPGAIRSFTGHFAPHVAFGVCVAVILVLLPALMVDGVDHGLSAPTSWTAVIPSVVIGLSAFTVHELLRRFHNRHRCRWCDRNGARHRHQAQRLGFLARHFHWRREMPGAWIYVVAWLAVTGFMIISTVGVLVLYAGMALALASTIVHQARQRSCPLHEATIMLDPSSKWFSIERLLGELHFRARGAEYLHLQCKRYACDDVMVAESPEEAVIWALAHGDEHATRPGGSRMVLLRVTLDPPELELEGDRDTVDA
jgi:hypothetical protein